MFKKCLLLMLCCFFIIGALSCGTGSNIKAICEAAAGKLLNSCNPNDPAELAIIVTTSASLGTPLQANDINKSNLTNLCVDGLSSEDEPTELEKEYYISVINSYSDDCTTLAGQITTLVNTI